MSYSIGMEFLEHFSCNLIVFRENGFQRLIGRKCCEVIK